MKFHTILLQATGQQGGGFTFYILIAVVAILIIIFVAKSSAKNIGTLSQSHQLSQTNKVVKVSLTGGLIGLFIGNPVQSLNDRMKIECENGWEVVQILPDTNLNILTFALRIILLIITLLLYSPVNGYYIVLKKTKE